MDTSVPVRVIKSQEDIADLSNELMPRVLATVGGLGKVSVTGIQLLGPMPATRILFFLAGFYPSGTSFLDDNVLFWWLIDARKTGLVLSPNETAFWSANPSAGDHLRKMMTSGRWDFSSIAGIREEALQRGGSLTMYLCAPRMLYESNRPITDMGIFRTPFNHVISRDEIQVDDRGQKYIILRNTTTNSPKDRSRGEDERWNIIPVTRYAGGMRKGLFYEGETPTNICGTFYYHEPKSTTFLAFRSSETFFNKTQCALTFRGADVHDISLYAPAIGKHISGQIPANLMMSPMELLDSGLDYPQLHRWTRQFIEALPQTKRYVGYFHEMYAAEDLLDQEICVGGKSRDTDIIILTHMPGSRQVVTEILDTRSRKQSLESLIYLE